MPNALINETSPYLLQHAHNPVNWYPWGEEVLRKAKEEDKPILVSIGYAACHWCHVMERESFEDPETAAIMNEFFVNIKIDREERPDLDHIYMDAVQVMTGSGGWPLNVFLTPDKKPFYGGTYYPPIPMVNRPSWKQVLHAVAEAFQHKRKEIEEQAEGLTSHLMSSNNFGINTPHNDFSIEQIDAACENLLKQGDKQWGGFGAAPKFPQTFAIQFLLKYGLLEQKRRPEMAKAAHEHAFLSLNKMIEGGIYDQIGGGFARYATDKEWLVPHFEKMLYDNALLVTTLSEAYRITGWEQYKTVIQQTLEFVEREMLHPSYGFYAALDADSEGEEGKFYVWTLEDVKRILGTDADIYCEFYDITAEGNWEHRNILRIKTPLAVFAAEKKIDVTTLKNLLKRCNKRMLEARALRIRPALDDKIILGWNALMNAAYSHAYAATGIDAYRQTAIRNMQFLLENFADADGVLMHVWKNNEAKFPAFLDDYAYLIQALLQLYKVTAHPQWLQRAKKLCEKVLQNFVEPSGYFYYTPQQQQDVIIRKKEVYDGATPSGNAVMALNLLELGMLFDKRDWVQQAQQMITGVSTLAVKYPTSFGMWLMGYYQLIKGTKEIVLCGAYERDLSTLLQQPLPFNIIMATHEEDEQYPLLKGKVVGNPLAIYLCENYACKQPVFDIESLLQQLND